MSVNQQFVLEIKGPCKCSCVRIYETYNSENNAFQKFYGKYIVINIFNIK